MIKQTNEFTFDTIEEVYEAVKMFEKNFIGLSESGKLIDNGDIIGTYDIISDKGSKYITLITEVVINA